MSDERPGVREIAPGLYQSALAHASVDTEIVKHVDVAVLMASLAEPMPPGLQELVIFPIDDNAAGTEHFEAVRNIARTVKDQRVLTICHMGENRSGLLSTPILVERGMKPKDAVALVQKNGPVNSSDQTHSFWNPGFVRQVLELGDGA